MAELFWGFKPVLADLSVGLSGFSETGTRSRRVRTESEHALRERIQNYRAEKLPNSGLYSRPETCRGTDGSNPLLSATESHLSGFSARIGEIARAYGFIYVMRGTGEDHFPAVRAQDAAKVSVGK
jgi:hypothetical protein